MRVARTVPLALLAALLITAPAAAAGPRTRVPALGSPVPAPPATRLFRTSGADLAELSGVGAGIRSQGVLYAQDDSGGGPRFFALDARSGRVLATYRVPGAVNHDWEDLAVAPDARGTPSVWIGDLGDNAESRTQIEIYRLPEPRVAEPRGGASRRYVTASTARPALWRLRYPDGPHDAESLAVSPGGRAYLVTKSLTGRSEVFAVPRHPDAGRVRTVHRIGTIHFTPTGSPSPYPLFGSLAATGAALSSDGRTLAVRTYSDVYLWPVRGGDVGAAIRTPPTRFPAPVQPQGEGVCFDGGALVTDSEHVGSTVYRIVLPMSLDRPHRTGDPSDPSPTPARSGPATGPLAAAARSASGPSARPTRSPESTGHSGVGGTVVAVLILVLAALVGLVVRRRRRPRP